MGGSSDLHTLAKDMAPDGINTAAIKVLTWSEVGQSVPRYVQNNQRQVGAVDITRAEGAMCGCILFSALFKMHITPLLLAVQI